MSSPGDWMCGVCQYVNFKRRESCQNCGFPKYGTEDDIPNYVANMKGRGKGEAVLAGDWYCQIPNCRAHNFASRAGCFRCGNLRSCDYGAIGYSSDQQQQQQQQQLVPGWKAGDWICTRHGCGLHNYACRTECYKCKLPRDFGGAM